MAVVATCGAANASRAAEVEVPLNIGIGPAAYLMTGPVYKDQPVHAGLKLSIAAVVDQATLRQARDRIPARYRSTAARVGEARVGLIYLPESLIISPKVRNTGMYGATWRPLAAGFSLLRRPRLSVSAGVLLTYLYMHSETLAAPMHFVRPGLNARVELEVPVSKAFLLGFGWDSQFYVPQRVGGTPLEVDRPRRSVWHLGQGFILLNFRVPHTTQM